MGLSIHYYTLIDEKEGYVWELAHIDVGGEFTDCDWNEQTGAETRAGFAIRHQHHIKRACLLHVDGNLAVTQTQSANRSSLR